MSQLAGNITAPVSIHDLQQVIPVTMQRTVAGETQTKSSADLGVLIKAEVGDTIPATDGQGSYTVTARQDINKWARYKPVRTTTAIVAPITFNTRKGVNFGLEIPFCRLCVMNAEVYYLLEEAVVNDRWNYLKPRGDRTPQGGVKEFFRLTDFARDPSETTQAASYFDGDPTPVALQGYNHNAQIPFYAFLNVAGISERQDADGKYYEVNMQVVNALTVSFYNSQGNDLHLQDFIDLDATYPNNAVWRPVIQVFNGYKPAGGEDWWLRSSPDVEAAGDAITASQTATWSVTLDLTDSNFTPFIGVNESFHMCIGVGCVNDDFSSWKDNNESLFILPYTDQQYVDIDFPFYYRFKLVSYMARHLNVTAISYFRDGLARWDAAGGTAPYFTIEYNATGALRLTMTITKLDSQTVDFVGEHGTAQTTGADPLKIQAREMTTGSGVETTFYLTPATSTWNAAQYINVPIGDPSETVTLYATVNVGTNIPVGGYGEFHLYANTGGTRWDNIGYFSIHRLS